MNLVLSTKKTGQTLTVWHVQHGYPPVPPDGSQIEQRTVVTTNAAHAQTHTAQVIIEDGGGKPALRKDWPQAVGTFPIVPNYWSV